MVHAGPGRPGIYVTRNSAIVGCTRCAVHVYLPAQPSPVVAEAGCEPDPRASAPMDSPSVRRHRQSAETHPAYELGGDNPSPNQSTRTLTHAEKIPRATRGNLTRGKYGYVKGASVVSVKEIPACGLC